MDALNANGKAKQVRKPSYTLRKTPSQRLREREKKRKEKKKNGEKNKNEKNKKQQEKEKKKKKLLFFKEEKWGGGGGGGNRRAIDVHCWQGFSAVLRPVKTGGSAPFRFKCSSSSFSSFVIWRISTRRNLNCQNSSKSLNLCKGFVLSRKIRFLWSSRQWR